MVLTKFNTMKIITPDCLYQQDINQYKNNLKHLKPGSRVLIKRSDPAGISEALIGNWELNLVSIPVEPYSTPASVMEFIQQDCSPHAIVNCTDNEIIFEFLDGGELSPETDHAIFYTSGTTGNPKGVVQTREGMKHNALTVAELHGFNSNSVHLTALPLYHCNAAAMSLFGNYFVNGTVIFLKKFTPSAYFDNIKLFGVQTANLVPTQVADLVNAKLEWPETLKYVLTAATALSQEICRDFYDLYGPKIRQGYGLSELVNFSFTMPMLDNDEFKRHMVDNYPPVGIPLPGTDFQLVDGEVLIKQPSIMRCYWNNPEATTATITKDGYLRTGDRGELRNGYLVLTGRFKEIIIRGGENYSPVMIEDEFRRSGICGDLAVVANKDLRLGEDIALVCSEYQKINLKNKKLQPASVRYGTVLRTQTRKPRRREMSIGLVSKALPNLRYADTLAAAGRLADKILKYPVNTPQQKYLNDIARKLSCYSGPGTPYTSVVPYFNAIDEHLDSWWNNRLPKHIFAGLDWNSLMKEHPMGGFPLLCHEFCEENNVYNGKLLEVGAGVGNFSQYIPSNTDYTRTDISDKFLQGCWQKEHKLDINQPYNLGTFDSIIGVNVFHCSSNKLTAIKNAYNALNPGGILLLSEGQNPEEVWALDLLFGFIDGWWDQGGFIDRYQWLEMFHTLEHKEIGYSVYREGNWDLGGLIWLKK